MGLETKNTEIQLIDDDPVIVVDEEEKQPLKIDENQPGMINEKDQKVDANQQESINEKVQPVEIVDIEIDDTVDVNQPGLINKNDQQVGPNQSAINEKDQIDTPMVELIEDDVDLVEDNNGQKNNEINNAIDNGKNSKIEPIEKFHPPAGFKFPKKKYGDKNRGCLANWFHEYPWLTYKENTASAQEESNDKIFCSFCIKAVHQNLIQKPKEMNFIDGYR